MVQFNYETKNLWIRSKQKQRNRLLTTSGGGASGNSRTSRCSACKNRITRFNNSAEEQSCEECFAINPKAKLIQSLSDIENSQGVKRFMPKETPHFNIERVQLRQVLPGVEINEDTPAQVNTMMVADFNNVNEMDSLRIPQTEITSPPQQIGVA